MSTVGGSAAHRITLGYLAERYGLSLLPTFASNVTITSLADDLDSITPGALFIATADADADLLERSELRGAYAVLLPPTQREQTSDPQFPILFGQPDAAQLGALAADIAGSPSQTLAMFAVCSTDDGVSCDNSIVLRDFLHILGNPVALISSEDSSSLDRELHASYPLGILDVQHFLSLAAEDGASAVVISLDRDSLADGAVNGVGIDVLGVAESRLDDAHTNAQTDTAAKTNGKADASHAGRQSNDLHAIAEQAAQRFGLVLDNETHVVGRTSESDTLAEHSSLEFDDVRLHQLSLAISMAMAAGVRRNTIRNALRLSRGMR